MDNFQIETAQNVNIAQNIANLGDRVLAFLVDILIIIAYEIIMMLIFGALNGSPKDTWILIMVFGLPPFLYHLLMETFNNGQSLGKAALKIRVVKIDGSKPAFSNYAIRWLLRIIDFSLTSGACALVAFLLNGKGQRLGDLAAGTTVISEKQNVSIRDTLMVDIPVDYIPVYPQVTVFSDHDMQTIKIVFKRANHNRNYEVIESLALKVAAVMDVIREESPLPFIKRVISDYNYYTQQ